MWSLTTGDAWESWCFNKPGQAQRKTVDRATRAAAVVVNNFAPVKGRPIESPIAALKQRVWACAIRLVEVMQSGQQGGRGNLDDGSAAIGELLQLPPPPVVP